MEFNPNKEEELGKRLEEIMGHSVKNSQEGTLELKKEPDQLMPDQKEGEGVEINPENLKNAGAAADKTLGDLEVKSKETFAKEKGLEEWRSSKEGNVLLGILKDPGFGLFSLGITYGIGKIWEGKISKKYETGLAKIRAERENIIMEKIKIEDPALYKMEMASRRLKTEQLTPQERNKLEKEKLGI